MKKLLTGFLLLLLVPQWCQGKLPGHPFLAVSGGYAFNGIQSQGTPFLGRTLSVGLGYLPMPDARVGIQMSASFRLNAYRHFFDKQIFVEHIQKGISTDVLATMAIGKRSRLLVGVNVFLPYRAVVDMGQKDFNQTYFYSNDSLINRYKRTSLQASAVIAFDYTFGKKKMLNAGFRLEQSGISPVKQDAVYYDAMSNAITLSTRMKPASVQIYFVAHIMDN